MIEHIEQGTLAPNIRACIALTSWKKRINTVGLTIYNLFETCGPDYHIVLTLAEEEFPKKEQELPRDLVLMNKAGMFEILWVKKNYRAFKKWLFCAKRYQRVPIISADDDCIYTCNYAEELYRAWKVNKTRIYTFNSHKYTGFQHGPTTLYPPNCFQENGIAKLTDVILATNHDDVYYGVLARRYNIQIYNIDDRIRYVFHDCTDALSERNGYNIVQAVQIIMREL